MLLYFIFSKLNTGERGREQYRILFIITLKQTQQTRVYSFYNFVFQCLPLRDHFLYRTNMYICMAVIKTVSPYFVIGDGIPSGPLESLISTHLFFLI